MLRRFRVFVTRAHYNASLCLSSQDVASVCNGIQFLELLISQQAQTSLSSPTDTQIIHAILKIWCIEKRNARSNVGESSPIGAIQPEVLLRWVDQLASNSSANQQYDDAVTISLSRESYRYLMDGDLANVELVEQLFQRMLQSLDPDMSPTVDDFHRVIHANIVNGRVRKAESHFQSLLQLHRSNLHPDSVYSPTSRTYNLLIGGYARAELPHDADRILQQLLDDGIVQEPAPPAYCFETCLNAWASSGHKSAGHRAESLVLQMHRFGVPVTPQSFVKVIAAWTQSRRANGPERARAILRLLLSVFQEKCDSTGNNASISGSWTAADRRHDKVVLDAYLHVIRAFALTASRDRTAPDQCQSLLKELMSSPYFDALQSTSGTNASSRRNTLRKICFMVCLAWARSKRRNAVQHIERLLQHMETDLGLPLDRFCCNALLEARAKQGDGQGALQTWNQYFDSTDHESRLEPDVQSINSVLLALHRSQEDWGKSAAEQFWDRVRNRAGIAPNVVTFNTLLSIKGKSDKVETARHGEEYLAQLERLHSTHDAACRPNPVTYVKAIELWENVRDHPEEAIQRVQAHWASILRQGMTPSEAAYKAYMNVLERNGEYKFR
jgi:pentatricopeptide repeat protein